MDTTVPPEKRKKAGKKKAKPQEVRFELDTCKELTWSSWLSLSKEKSREKWNRGDSIIKEGASITIKGPIAWSESKKMPVGRPCQVMIFMEPKDEKGSRPGVVQNRRGVTEAALWLRETYFQHLHLILISGKPQVITIFCEDPTSGGGMMTGFYLEEEFLTGERAAREQGSGNGVD